MKSYHLRCLSVPILLAAVLLFPSSGLSQRPLGPGADVRTGAPSTGDSGVSAMGQLKVYVREPNGSPIRQMAIVTVTMMTRQYFRQVSTRGGYAAFEGVVAGTYSIQAVAPGYETTAEEVEVGGMNTTSSVDVVLRPAYNASAAAQTPAPPVLSPKAQKQLGLALFALRANKPGDAKSHLDNALHLAPAHPEVHFLYGVYYSELRNTPQALASWNKAVEIYPQHLFAHLSIGETLLHLDRGPEAEKELQKAIEIDPNSWRAHLLYSRAALHEHNFDDAEKHARRAIDLGHAQASQARLVLAEALYHRMDKSGAATQLHAYLQEHPADPEVLKALSNLDGPKLSSAPEILPATMTTFSPAPLPPPVMWMPADVDELTPPVESGVACQLPSLLQGAEDQVAKFLTDVERFSATESLKHESINPWGAVSGTVNQKYNYLVSYKQLRAGRYSVEEFRDGSLDMSRFPEGIATIGLPSMILVFEKSQAQNYDFSCEGLTRTHDGLAWQVHFVQRADKPRVLRAYRLGPKSYPVGIKGRAWIAADTYQVLRMETDLTQAQSDIRLLAEHIDIEYGPVAFKNQKEQLWVPQNANIYFDWQGHRVHRLHSFDNYVLFAVDEQERISAPKEPPPQASPNATGGTPPPQQ